MKTKTAPEISQEISQGDTTTIGALVVIHRVNGTIELGVSGVDDEKAMSVLFGIAEAINQYCDEKYKSSQTGNGFFARTRPVKNTSQN